jgi:hypothetical protein
MTVSVWLGCGMQVWHGRVEVCLPGAGVDADIAPEPDGLDVPVPD